MDADDDYTCRDRNGDDYPEHDFGVYDGHTSDCRRCGAEPEWDL